MLLSVWSVIGDTEAWGGNEHERISDRHEKNGFFLRLFAMAAAGNSLEGEGLFPSEKTWDIF